MNTSTIIDSYNRVEHVIQENQAQRESVKDKATPFRVEFRYGGGSRSYQYFETFEAARLANQRKAGYSPFGRAVIEHPTSQQIQVKGPRGGWRAAGEGGE